MQIINYNDKWWLVDNDELTPLDAEKSYQVIKSKQSRRTILQNSSLHKYFSLVAEALNDGGFTIQKVVALFKKAGLSWEMSSVKEVIWRNIQVATVSKASTTQLNSDEVTKVYKNVDFYLSDKVGIEHIPFPSVESMLMEKRLKD